MTLRLSAPCPYCGSPNDAVTGVNAARPAPGSVSMCLQCGGLALFVRGIFGILTIRPPTAAELIDLLADPLIVRMLDAHKQLRDDS